MSGPAGSRDHQPRGNGAHAVFPVRSIGRSPERDKIPCAFLLTLTYMDAGHTDITIGLTLASWDSLNSHSLGNR